MSTLIERMQQLQQAEQSLNEVIQEAWRSLPYSPETACAKFLAGEDQVAALSQQWEQWLGEFCAFDALKSDEFRDQTDYRMSQTRSFLAQGKGTALSLLGRLYEAQQAYDRAIALLDDSGNPFQASLTEDLGRLALQQGKFIEAERYYRQAYIRYMQLASPDAWKAIVDSNDVDKSAGFSLEGAVRCLGSLAMVALQRGERDTYLGREMEAIEFAKIHNLYHFERSLWLNLYTWLLHWDAKGEIQAELKQELKNRKRELEQKIQGLERASLKVDMLLLEVENSIALDRATAAEARLKDAQVILEKHTNLVDKSWKLHMAYASFYELQERIGESTEHAEAALEIAREMGWPDLIQQALYMVVSLLDRGAAEHQARKKHILDGTIETLGRVQAGETLARALLQRAEIQLTAKQYDAALADVGGAEALAATRDLRRQVLTAKAAVLKMRGHKEEAYSSLHAAIQLCREQMLPEGQPSAKSYRDLLHQTETLYVGAALLAAELGRAHDAFAWAEQGRSCLLRQQLAQSGRALADDMWSIPQPRYDQKLRESLQTESAAFFFFCIGTGRTLALLLDPQEAVPRPFFLDLKEADLHESRLAEGLWPETGTSEKQFIQFLAELSGKLLTPIQEVLLDVMGRSEVLYIVPDSRLYLVPFSALTLNDAPLHDYCALALAPSVGLWQWCRARRPIEQTRTCLAIGVGQEDRVSFADQTRAVMAGCNWKKAPTYLLDDEVPVRSDGVWELAKKHTVIHFSCHGMEEPTALDTLSALYLELSGKEKFYAKDVFNRKDELFAELVFLNACMSGRFKLRKGLAIGGFWEAFLQAGATSLIATLAKVHPEDAEQLAHTFYKAWLEQNVSKARALQLAQQELRRKKTKSFHWARYVLIGDHR